MCVYVCVCVLKGQVVKKFDKSNLLPVASDSSQGYEVLLENELLYTCKVLISNPQMVNIANLSDKF